MLAITLKRVITSGALDLLDGLLIKDASDEEVRKLRDEVFAARKLSEQEEKQASDQKQNDLVENP